MALTRQEKRPGILVVCDYYLPGFESGGAMRTIVNMTARLGDEFDFWIVTRDHDGPNDLTPYTGVQINEWNRVENANVYYLSRGNTGPLYLRRLIKEVSPDAIYVNSFFSPMTIAVLTLKKLGLIGDIPVVLAPEGEFSPGALTLKAAKKQLYIRSAKLLGLLADITWKAASDSERDDIETSVGKTPNIFIAPNLPPVTIYDVYEQVTKPAKTAGQARMVFLSRFMRKKNFNWLLDNISGVKGDLTIDICGPLEDADYWDETQRIIETLPPNIDIEAKGPVPHDRVATTLADYHFFVLPTLGENFGHVFIEALASGCPLIISDRTPWRQLEEKSVGWDLPLEDVTAWVETLNACVAMNGPDYDQLSRNARDFAVAWLSDPELEASNREVLRFAVAHPG